MIYGPLKRTTFILLGLSMWFSSNAYSEDLMPTGDSFLLRFKVLSWQPEDVIAVKYPGPVSTERIRNALETLVKTQGWTGSEKSFEIVYEKGDKIGQVSGTFSEKRRFSTHFTLDLQKVRDQFPGFDTLIIDFVSNNGFAYQSTLSANGDESLDSQQGRLSFQKEGIGISSYRIRYVLQPGQLHFPVLRITSSLSQTWVLKTALLLIFFLLMPSVVLYLLLRRGVSRNEKGKIRLSPAKSLLINIQFPLMLWTVTTIGCADVTAMLIRNRLLGGILGITTVPILSFLIFLSVLHRYEKATRGTTWRFRENLLTNLRTLVLGTPALLLPFCYLGTQKIFPGCPFTLLLAFLFVQYAVLTFLFSCVLPFIIRWIWKGQALADGRLRQRLQRLSQKAGITYRDIILLQTKKSKLANAWVAGILPQWRSLFLTDYLLEHLTHAEIETVFAHELGHLKYKHLLKQIVWIVLGFGGQLVFVRLGVFLFSSLNDTPSGLYWTLFMVINFGAVFLLGRFGLMGFWRRMEFEADAYAVALTQQPALFLGALRKLIQLNDAPEDLGTFNEMLSTHPNFKARADAIGRKR